jgi:hypothetical protein
VSSPWHGIEVDIDDVRKITTTWGSGERELPFNDLDCRLGDSREKPLRPEDQRVILGFKVLPEVAVDRLGSDETWMAAELGCEDLERKTHYFRDGEPGGYTFHIATKAVAVAPKSSLFAIPDGAREMTNSEYLAVIGKSPIGVPAQSPGDGGFSLCHAPSDAEETGRNAGCFQAYRALEFCSADNDVVLEGR